jgi:hypothetical protein
MTPTDAQGAAPRCECGHERDKHSLRGGICLHRAPSGGWIECPCLAYRPPPAGPPPAPAAPRVRCECARMSDWPSDEHFSHCPLFAAPAAEPREFLAQELVGYVVWDKRGSTIYRGRVYWSLPAAQKVRDGVVWHARDSYEVRGILLDGGPTHVG